MDQTHPTVAMGSNSNFVVSWAYDSGGGDYDIYYAGYNRLGVRLYAGWVASSGYREDYPSVAMADNGQFVVSYSAYLPWGYSLVRARRFNASGVPFGDWFTVASGPGYGSSSSSVACAPDGRFAVAFREGYDVFLRRYNAAGGAVGQTKVASGLVAFRGLDVAMDVAGSSMVTWSGRSAGATTFDVFARRVSFAGVASPVRVVDNTSTVDATWPSVAMDRSDGDYVVVYESGRLFMLKEFSAVGGLKGQAGLGRYRAPAVSMAGTDAYFVAYAGISSGAFGRFGFLR
jgi:hypothetical protein